MLQSCRSLAEQLDHPRGSCSHTTTWLPWWYYDILNSDILVKGYKGWEPSWPTTGQLLTLWLYLGNYLYSGQRCNTRTCRLDVPLTNCSRVRTRKLASPSYPCKIKKGVLWKSYVFVNSILANLKSYFIVSCRYHVYGLVVNTMHAMLAGAKSIILPKSVEKYRWEKYWKYSQRFEPDSFVSSLAKHQPHFFNLVPPLVSSILNTKDKT